MLYLVENFFKESFLASVFYSWQEFSASCSKNNPVAGKEICW
jgi:hypothetical protein